MKWDHMNACVKMVIKTMEQIKIVKVCAAIATCIIVLNYRHSLESVYSIGRDTHIIVIMQF